MTKQINKINFYRIILFAGAASYIIFAFVYRINSNIYDPMSFGERIISSVVFSTALFMSYKNEFVKNNIEIISYFLSLSAILQLFYYNHLIQFNLGLSIPLIIIIAVFNLIFDFNKLKFYTNLILVILISLSLYICNSKNFCENIFRIGRFRT
jgi:hypothetical protein